MNETWLNVAGQPVPGYKAAQYGSSLLGLPLLAILVARWLATRSDRAENEVPALDPTVRAGIGLVGLAVPAATSAVVWLRSDASAYQAFGSAVKAAGLALGVAVVVYGSVYEFSHRNSVSDGSI